MSSSPGGTRRGFTFPELMVVVVIAALVIAGLQQALVGQLRFHETQRGVSQRNESLRHALATLGTTLREASVEDFEVLTADSLRARVPHGTGLVCGVDADGSHIGVVDPRGQWQVGDSIVFQRFTGRHVGRIAGIDPAGSDVPCSLLASGSILRLDEAVPDAVAGTGARPFRSQVLATVTLDGAWWLSRLDGASGDVVAGPLVDSGGFAAWYEDLAGTTVPAAAAERVALRVVLRAPRLREGQPVVADTLFLRFGGRNR